MAGTIFERTLVTAEAEAAFADAAIVAGMVAFESALAEAEAAEGLIPASAAAAIVAACAEAPFDTEAIVVEARTAGALAIPLVRLLRERVAQRDAAAAAHVHFGSTSQDAIDTALMLATREAVALIDADLVRLVASLEALAAAHRATPMLGRTLLQPAQETRFGVVVESWVAPVRRGRERLASAARDALQVQLGGAVGTLAPLGDRGPAVMRRMAARLGLGAPPSAWHTERDATASLACTVAVLCGSLGKIGRDLSLLSQAEVAEVAEPHAPGRGSSSAMPHKRNPVAALVALSAAARAPHLAATVLAAMPQALQRGLGDWQAELAAWPSLFMAAHGAVQALADACEAGLEVDAARMLANLESHRRALAAATPSSGKPAP